MISLIDKIRFAIDRSSLTEPLIEVADVPNAVYNLRLTDRGNQTFIEWDYNDVQGMRHSESRHLLASATDPDSPATPATLLTPYSYLENFIGARLATTDITTNTAIPTTGDGLKIQLIAANTEAKGGLKGGEPFLSNYFGGIEIDVDTQGVLEATLVFTHVIGSNSFKAKRIRTYNMNPSRGLTLNLNAFDSFTIVPNVGSVTTRDGTTFNLTARDLEDPSHIEVYLYLKFFTNIEKTTRKAVNIEDLIFERPQLVFRQLQFVTDAEIKSRNLKGDKGDPGPPGEGIVAGGTAGQILAKKSTTDYDTEWVDNTGGISEVFTKEPVQGSGTEEDPISIDENALDITILDNDGTPINTNDVGDAVGQFEVTRSFGRDPTQVFSPRGVVERSILPQYGGIYSIGSIVLFLGSDRKVYRYDYKKNIITLYNTRAVSTTLGVGGRVGIFGSSRGLVVGFNSSGVYYLWVLEVVNNVLTWQRLGSIRWTGNNAVNWLPDPETFVINGDNILFINGSSHSVVAVDMATMNHVPEASFSLPSNFTSIAGADIYNGKLYVFNRRGGTHTYGAFELDGTLITSTSYTYPGTYGSRDPAPTGLTILPVRGTPLLTHIYSANNGLKYLIGHAPIPGNKLVTKVSLSNVVDVSQAQGLPTQKGPWKNYIKQTSAINKRITTAEVGTLFIAANNSGTVEIRTPASNTGFQAGDAFGVYKAAGNGFATITIGGASTGVGLRSTLVAAYTGSEWLLSEWSTGDFSNYFGAWSSTRYYSSGAIVLQNSKYYIRKPGISASLGRGTFDAQYWIEIKEPSSGGSYLSTIEQVQNSSKTLAASDKNKVFEVLTGNTNRVFKLYASPKNGDAIGIFKDDAASGKVEIQNSAGVKIAELTSQGEGVTLMYSGRLWEIISDAGRGGAAVDKASVYNQNKAIIKADTGINLVTNDTNKEITLATQAPTWLATVSYKKGQIVEFHGRFYIALATVAASSTTPVGSSDWQLLGDEHSFITNLGPRFPASPKIGEDFYLTEDIFQSIIPEAVSNSLAGHHTNSVFKSAAIAIYNNAESGKHGTAVPALTKDFSVIAAANEILVFLKKSDFSKTLKTLTVNGTDLTMTRAGSFGPSDSYWQYSSPSNMFQGSNEAWNLFRVGSINNIQFTYTDNSSEFHVSFTKGKHYVWDGSAWNELSDDDPIIKVIDTEIDKKVINPYFRKGFDVSGHSSQDIATKFASPDRPQALAHDDDHKYLFVADYDHLGNSHVTIYSMYLTEDEGWSRKSTPISKTGVGSRIQFLAYDKTNATTGILYVGFGGATATDTKIDRYTITAGALNDNHYLSPTVSKINDSPQRTLNVGANNIIGADFVIDSNNKKRLYVVTASSSTRVYNPGSVSSGALAFVKTIAKHSQIQNESAGFTNNKTDKKLYTIDSVDRVIRIWDYSSDADNPTEDTTNTIDISSVPASIVYGGNRFYHYNDLVVDGALGRIYIVSDGQDYVFILPLQAQIYKSRYHHSNNILNQNVIFPYDADELYFSTNAEKTWYKNNIEDGLLIPLVGGVKFTDIDYLKVKTILATFGSTSGGVNTGNNIDRTKWVNSAKYPLPIVDGDEIISFSELALASAFTDNTRSALTSSFQSNLQFFKSLGIFVPTDSQAVRPAYLIFGGDQHSASGAGNNYIRANITFLRNEQGVLTHVFLRPQIINRISSSGSSFKLLRLEGLKITYK